MSNSTGLIVFAALVLESSARSSPSWSPRAILTRRTSSMRRRYSMASPPSSVWLAYARMSLAACRRRRSASRRPTSPVTVQPPAVRSKRGLSLGFPMQRIASASSPSTGPAPVPNLAARRSRLSRSLPPPRPPRGLGQRSPLRCLWPTPLHAAAEPLHPLAERGLLGRCHVPRRHSPPPLDRPIRSSASPLGPRAFLVEGGEGGGPLLIHLCPLSPVYDGSTVGPRPADATDMI